VQAERKAGKPIRPRAIEGALGLAAVLMIALCAATAATAAPAEFGNFCQRGQGAGQCTIPHGVATSPLSGHIYLADEENQRIDEFSAWGEFIRAWGWGVRTGASELETCTTESSCRKGLTGSGVGQFSGPVGVAVDSAGDVYVVDWQNHRVQKFDSEGHFLLMFGGEVDQGPNHAGNVCTAAFIADGDTCGAGTAGTGNGQFAAGWKGGPFDSPFSGIGIAIGPADEVYVGDENRIQVFDTGGSFQRQLPLPHGGTVGALAADPVTGNLYMAFPNIRLETQPAVPNVYRLDQSTGAVLDTLEVDKPSAVAVDGSGRVYVFDNRLDFGAGAGRSSRVLVFDAAGTLVEAFAGAEYFSEEEIASSTGIAASDTCFSGGQGGVYLSEFWIFEGLNSALHAYSPTPDPALCPPPQVPPSIDSQFAAAVDAASATLKAGINPHYFTENVGTTTYFVQYGTAACIEAEGWVAGCVSSQPVPPATLKGPPVNEAVMAAVGLSKLLPATEYRYRFVAEGSGAPGEPVVGAGGEPGVEGASAAFTTMPLPSPPAACENDSRRIGTGASLPDCRAYEMVSPLEKAGGDALARLNIVPFEARMDQASTSGDALTFSAYRPFQDPESAPYSSQYLSKRDPVAGWSTEFVSPPQEGEAFVNQLFQLDNLYRAFTEDLGLSFLMTDTEPVLGPGGLAGHPNIYRRESGTGAYAACTSAVPQLSDQSTLGPQLQGFADDGHLAVFRLENKLTADASSTIHENGTKGLQLYACSYEGGVASVHLVSALPNGTASEAENTAGGPANEEFQRDQGRTESLENAVSSDGTKVFWTAASGPSGKNPGALFVRLNPGAEPTGGTCVASEPEKACTLQISAGPARFWTAAEDGSLAIFSAGGLLSEFQVADKKTRPIAGKVLGVLGASADAKRVYFVSADALDPEATPGEPNLYLHDAVQETDEFIATLGKEDLSQDNSAPGPINPEPVSHTARVTPNGATAVFMSSDPQLAEEVAGYDNTDQLSGKPAAEIYRYALGEGLACISCNRTGARPRGREIQNSHIFSAPIRPAAALLPPWLNSLHAPQVLSDGGDRVYFEGFEALASADTNERADVYQWERQDAGSCTASEASFDPAAGGCLTLISSGKATTDSQFVDAAPQGRDVFIRTASSLVPWDPGQIDIYDAREGGGFPAPPKPPAECEGEACQSPPPGPSNSTPASSSYQGPGNLKQRAGSKCPKGSRKKASRKGTVRCAKNHKRHHGKKNSRQTRRAGR
jgi:DNA-binding beta-propeller fold protein YncE